MIDVAIGVDIGSSGTRAVAMSAGGREIAVTQSTDRPPAGSAEPDAGFHGLVPTAVRDEVLSALGAVVSSLRHAEVRAIGITCFRQTLVVHEDGRPLAAFNNDVAVDRRWVRDGIPLASSLAEPRLRWLADAVPSVFEVRTPTVATLGGWLAGSLTGHYVEEPTSASTTGLLEPGVAKWTRDAHDLAGELGVALPPLVGCGDVAGYVRSDIAASLGLTTQPPVVVAGGDAQAAAYVARLVEPDATVLSCGTHWQQLTPVTGTAAGEPMIDAVPVRRTASHRLGETYRETLVYYPGATFAEIAGGVSGAGDLERPPNVQVFFRSSLDLSVSIDLGRPVVTWSAPIDDQWWPDLRLAVVVGSSLTLERVLQQAHGSRPLVMVGGATRSTLWRSAIAAALGRPLVTLPGVEAASLGAAYLAWGAIGNEPVGGRSEATSLRDRAEHIVPGPEIHEFLSACRGPWASARNLLGLDVDEGGESV